MSNLRLVGLQECFGQDMICNFVSASILPRRYCATCVNFVDVNHIGFAELQPIVESGRCVGTFHHRPSCCPSC